MNIHALLSWQYTVVSGQLHALAALLPEKMVPISIKLVARVLELVRTFRSGEKTLASAVNLTRISLSFSQ